MSQYFTFLSMKLHADGPRDGPAVVLVHGIPGSAAGWRVVAGDLARDHRVVVPDLLGFGASPRPAILAAPAQAAALARALGESGVTRAAFVGHDFGGPVVLSLYADRPELFTHLALMSTNAFPDTPIPFPLATVTWPWVGRAMARALFSGIALRMMLWRYGGRHLGDAGSVRTIFTDALRHLEQRYRHYPGVMESVRVPALVAWGARDPFFPIAQAHRTAAALRGSELHVLPGAGHFLPEERPLDVARLVRALVREARGRRTPEEEAVAPIA